jgi:hypothetical protein
MSEFIHWWSENPRAPIGMVLVAAGFAWLIHWLVLDEGFQKLSEAVKGMWRSS